MSNPSPSWLQRLLLLATPTPIIVGSKWGSKDDKGNPWAEWLVEVEGVKNGFVLYRYIKPNEGYRSSSTTSGTVGYFRRFFRRVDQS